MLLPLRIFAIAALLASLSTAFAKPQNKTPQTPPATKPPSSKNSPPQLTPEEELQEAINKSGNDRAALVPALEAYLAKYPQTPQRPQIYRALVEACLQLRDSVRAANYAERLVSLKPDDMSITLLAIQLLERNGDEAGLHRAVNYSSRVLEFVDSNSPEAKSPKISQDEWLVEKKRDQSAILLLRGRLNLKLKDYPAAQKDFETSSSLLPSAGAAEKLGELFELKSDLNAAITQYARAFALADGSAASANRREIRQKLGNTWRLVHGSDAGLGDYLLHSFDDVAEKSSPTATKKNASAKEPFEFTLRKVPDQTAVPLAYTKGRVLVINFWATWCGPCRALEPQFEAVANRFDGVPDISFIAANCDEDETLVAPYVEEEKLHSNVFFADGLDRLFAVNSFPTVLVIDRNGKVAYRSEGFGDDTFEKSLTAAAQKALAAPPATSATPASPASR